MTETIEVPISLIKAGNLDAIRELLPKENLFGRWAEHPEYGRGIITVAYPDPDGEVWIARESENRRDGADWRRVPLEDLTLDPVELATVEDFENAPEGTFVTTAGRAPREKLHGGWRSDLVELDSKGMTVRGPWKVVRWSDGNA